MRRLRFAGAILGATVLAVTFVAVATADDDDGDGGGQNGFQTTQASMLSCPSCGTNVVPIITTGDTIGSYRFESIPDGIAISTGRGGGGGGGSDGDDDDDGDDFRAGGRDDDDDDDGRRFDIFVNHETSTVPFPFNPPFAASQGEANQNDFDNSQLSKLTLDRDAEVLNASMAITSSQNFQRFCSNYLATRKEGFDRPILFTNEEAQDWVFRTGEAWRGPGLHEAGTSGAEQAGVVAAYDVRNGTTKSIYGMGRLNHENSVAIPGYRDNVVLTTDDTFFTTPVGAPHNKTAWSQLYSYIADDTDDLMDDEGDLWAFVSNDPATDDYFDFAPGDTTKSVSGHFIKVPKHIATGKHPTLGRDLLSTDFTSPDMLEPPTGVVGPPPNGPQWVLDQWGNAENNAGDGVAPAAGENVFRFVRLEDVAYDKRRGKENIVYLVDSGRGTAPGGGPPPSTSTNGRVWKMVLDKKDPKKVISLSVFLEGDDNPVKTLGEMHQPDNIESTRNSLLITEDPGSSQQFPFGSTDPAATSARLWRFNLNAPPGPTNPSVVATVDQTADEGPTDVDGPQNATPPHPVVKANLGSWESSGIVDASDVLGRGWFLITIQAHTLWIQKQDGPDRLGTPNGKDFTFKREGGQLLAIRIPGA